MGAGLRSESLGFFASFAINEGHRGVGKLAIRHLRSRNLIEAVTPQKESDCQI